MAAPEDLTPLDQTPAPPAIQAPAAPAARPPVMPTTGAPELLNRLSAREKEIEALTPQLDQRWGAVQQGYTGLQEGQSALKALLQNTSKRLEGAFAPASTTERLSGILGAVATARPGGGFGNAAGMGALAGEQQMKEGRALNIEKEQLMAKYGIDAVQADQMARQYGIQGQMAGLQGLQSRLQNAESGADRMSSAYATSQMNSNKYDPALQAQLAYGKENMKNQADMAMLGAASQQGGAPDPLSKAYASYQVAFPSPPSRATPIQKMMYDMSLNKVLAVNPQFQQGNIKIANDVRTKFDVGSAQGDKVRFINNVMGHMKTYDEINQAMDKGDVPGANMIALKFGQAFGHPELTNAEAVQGFLGDELVNSIVPRGGTGAEREQSEARIRASLAPQQWNGVKDTYNSLLATQLGDLERQFRSSLHFMPKQMIDEEWSAKVTPQAQQMLDAHDKVPGQDQFKSLDEVKAAVAGGKLPRAQGEVIARQNGWIQ